jgi:hypothetical protein
MGDVGETFKALKEHVKAVKKNRLLMADDSIWKKHTDYHWFNYLSNGDKAEYWPSTGKMGIKGNIFHINSKKGKKVLSELNAQIQK